MARLRAVTSRLVVQPQRMAVRVAETERERFAMRDEARPSRKWMKTARWQRLRWAVLKRAQFTCERPDCGRVEVDTSKLVADHKIAHRDDEALFWDDANLWCLCKTCHDGWKQSIEARQGW